MNVVFFMQDTGAIFGAEKATIDLACGLRDAGEHVRFFLMEESRMAGAGSSFLEEIERQKLPVTRFAVSGRISRSLSVRLKQAFKEVQGDVLHVVGYKANLHAWLSGIHPVVATVHGWLFRNDIKERFYDAIDRWCLRRCDHVVCLSSYYESLLLKSGVDRGRLSRIPSGLRDIPPEGIPDRGAGEAPGEFIFGMLGRFSEEKNHPMFLTAAREVAGKKPVAKFRIAGRGPLEADVKKYAEEMGLSGVVEFCGYQEVSSFMSSIDAFIICSKIENLPYSIMEAMAWSKPVIATKAGGMPDLVDDGITGVLVSPDHARYLAGAMLGMINDREKAIAMGRAGRKKLLSEFTLERSVREHQNMYRKTSAGEGE